MGRPVMSRGSDLSEREADALANMMNAEASRIDAIVGDVGEIKGDMRTLKADSARTANGVEQLQQSMVILSRHAVLMETQSAEITALRTKHDTLDARVQNIEHDMPALKETRDDVRKVQWAVGAAVLAAVMGLVLVSKP